MARVGFALLFGMITLASLKAQPIGEAAAPLAVRISSLLPRRTTVSLEFRIVAPLTTGESSGFRGALEDQLRKTGLDVTAATQPESRIRVALSENVRGLLFVAEVWNKDARQVVMLPWNPAPTAETRPAVLLVKNAVWEQSEPVLDFLLLDSGSRLLVLSASRVASLRVAAGKWREDGEAALVLGRPVPRDPRGRLETAAGALRAFLPGTTCSGAVVAQLTLTCAPGNESFALNPRDTSLAVRWVTDRNVLESDGVRGSFYAAADSLLSSSDDRIEDRAGGAIPGTEAWGSDLAAVENPCSPGTFVIAVVAGPDPQHDQAQVFELIGGQPVSRSEAVALPGRVTALWPAETPGQATLVAQNQKTGHYEASRLALACAQ